MASETAKLWDNLELQVAGARDVRHVKPPSLAIGNPSSSTFKYNLSPFFKREHWDISDGDYKALLPSMQLASNLLNSGFDFLASFAPSNRAHDQLLEKRAEDPTYYRVVQKRYENDQLQETRGELAEVAESVRWQLNETMARDKKWTGVTRLVTDDRWGPRPWTDLVDQDIAESDQDLRARGSQRRPLIVGIMKEYVDALTTFRPGTEEHLRASFLAAVTMTHEVAHVVWHQDFRSLDYSASGPEPRYNDDCVSELGLSFIAYIFGGYSPSTVDGQVPTNFSSALCWQKVFKEQEIDVLYRSDYSISTAYIERVLSQGFWDRLLDNIGAIEDSGWPAIARPALQAQIKKNPLDDSVAESRIPEWTVSKYDGEVIWRNPFSDSRLNLRDNKLLEKVTVEDKMLEIAQLKLANPNDKSRYNYGQGDVGENATSNAAGNINPAIQDATTPGPPRIPAEIQRIYEIAFCGARPTLMERFQQIQSAAAELANVMRPGGGHDSLRPHLRDLRSESAQEMLDNLADWEERQTAKEDQALRAVKPNEWVKKKRDDLKAELPPGTILDEHGWPVLTDAGAAPGKQVGSHMVDLYARVNPT
ncbi:uncharacterized protein L3040_001753 [Drepanopeziza brunnea f. sp. 'multigermtubi']|uniref:Uncharacterized protein n=1 Tax=Marssonina brunnea f. sp. multigermtubi (strain MB_m1) TaxID=1072389 RepID=K1WQT4_MARBU|nr:uncharacterized protein MBM_06602 [Drepanopeziza brunnea f. sp. 'multigermtubi' MB_m1]EKD15386.1 hypothetical protein MBM_06602 [Drepanopeziza brunnea f. sp. 'multigermtubi' MB_m1]KAJ5051993.1 hypothetical protein L3040_001753 [Drepanopeziza brunnea f. sp. 'multigermtubi']